MNGAANKQAGSRFERRVAKLSGGKRRPLSVDDTPIGGILEPNFRVAMRMANADGTWTRQCTCA